MKNVMRKNQKIICPSCGAPVVSEICAYCGRPTGLRTTEADTEYPVLECKEVTMNFWTVGFPLIFAVMFGAAAALVLTMAFGSFGRGFGNDFLVVMSIPFLLIGLLLCLRGGRHVLRQIFQLKYIRQHILQFSAEVFVSDICRIGCLLQLHHQIEIINRNGLLCGSDKQQLCDLFPMILLFYRTGDQLLFDIVTDHRYGQLHIRESGIKTVDISDCLLQIKTDIRYLLIGREIEILHTNIQLSGNITDHGLIIRCGRDSVKQNPSSVFEKPLTRNKKMNTLLLMGNLEDKICV